MRSRNRAIDVIALTPRCGVEPWAAVPRAVAVIQAPPRSASARFSSVASPTIAASWSRSPRSRRTFVPCRPASPRRPPGAGRACRRAGPRATDRRDGAERSGDGDLHVGRATPDQPAVDDLGAERWMPPRLGVTRGHHVQVSVPGERGPVGASEARDHARPVRLAADDPGEPSRSSRIAMATSATSSSVPPGFSLGVVMSLRAKRSTSSGSTPSTAARTAASSTMAANVPERRSRAPGGAASIRILAPIPGEGDRLAAVPLPLVEGDRLVLTRRTEHLSRHPGEISFPGGLTHEEDVDLSATALRETQEELGLAPDDVEVLGRSSRSTRSSRPSSSCRSSAWSLWLRCSRPARPRSPRCSRTRSTN